MAKLIVKKQGKVIYQTELVKGQEYFAGRSKNCDIVLDNEKGISRQHVKIYFDNNTWVAELTAKYGSLIIDGESKELIQLQNNVAFLMPPYEFIFYEVSAMSSKEFSDNNPTTEVNSTDIDEVNNPTPQTPNFINNENIENSITMSGNLDPTLSGQISTSAYLRVGYSVNEPDEIHQLVGNIWVAGRDETCDIYLNNQHVSRRHFNLRNGDEGFYITDLESINGTKVNGKKIPTGKPYRIFSGDTIGIMSLTIRFEIHDTKFENKLEVIPQSSPYGVSEQPYHIPQNAMAQNIPHSRQAPDGSYYGPNVFKVENGDESKSWKLVYKKKKKVIWAAALILIIAALFSEGEQKKKNVDLASKDKSYESLTTEQKSIVRDSFNLAKNYYTNGDHHLCLNEIKKLHTIIPSYENSRQVEGLCKQAIDIKKQVEYSDKIRREKRQAEEAIAAVTQKCSELLKSDITLESMRSCLAPAMELDPENEKIISLIEVIEEKDRKKQESLAAAAKRKGQIQSCNRKYLSAKAYRKSGDLLKTIKKLNNYLNSVCPDPKGYRSSAKREIASIKKELSVKIKASLDLCKKDYEESKFKSSVLNCKKALRVDPNNSEAKTIKSNAIKDLRAAMKTLYQDSVLEESLGNIEAAKEKWKQILSESLKGEEYFEKAKRKTHKYRE